MRDLEIDCPTFLRLTGATLGTHGMHVIEPHGVRYERTPADIAEHDLTSEEAAVLLDFVEVARLALPTTLADLIEWVPKQGGDFTIPPWTHEIANAESAKECRAALTKTKGELEMRLAEFENSPAATSEDRYAIRVLQSEVTAELRVIETLLDAVSIRSPGSGKATRFDAMAVEITAAINSLGGTPSPSKVMVELKRCAGKPGSCITKETTDGVEWQRQDGERERLTLDNLKSRLRRMKNAAKGSLGVR